MPKQEKIECLETNYQSHFGVYAIISDQTRQKILVIKKTLGCYTGLYDLPGGSMEPHELLEETLRREVFEETGCTITKAKHLCTLSTLYPHQKQGRDVTLRHIGVIYTAVIAGTPRKTSTGTDDSGGCVWVRWKDVSEKNAAPFVVMAINHLPEKRGQETSARKGEIRRDPARHFERMIGIGPSTAKDFVALGISSDRQLARQDPKRLCDKLRKLHGKPATGVARPNIVAAIEDLRSFKNEYGCYPSERY